MGARERMMNTLGVDPLSFNVGPNANRPSFSGGKSFFNNGGIVTNQNAHVKWNPETGKREVVSGNINIDQADKISDRISLESLKNDAIVAHGFHSVEHKEAQKQIMVLEGTPAEAILIKDDGKPIRVKGYNTVDGVATVQSDKDYWKQDRRNRFNRNVGGVADFMTGGIFDFDKRGSNKIQKTQQGVLDFMTMGITDFDKQNAVNLGEGEKDNVFKRIAGGAVDYMTMGLTDFDKRGAGALQFNPMGGGEDRKWGGDDKPNLTLADEQETKSSEGVSTTVDRTNDAVEVVTANQISGNSSTVNNSGGAGNEVPSFDVGVTRDVSKIRTLGLMLI